MIPPSLAKALDRVRQGADVMPARQLHRQLEKSLGVDWRSRLASFDETPIAAASIGQVRQERFRLSVTVLNVTCMTRRGEGTVSTSFSVAPRRERPTRVCAVCLCVYMYLHGNHLYHLDYRKANPSPQSLRLEHGWTCCTNGESRSCTVKSRENLDPFSRVYVYFVSLRTNLRTNL